MVIELREDVEIDPEVIEACRSLHGRGFALALDDFVPGSQAEAADSVRKLREGRRAGHSRE